MLIINILWGNPTMTGGIQLAYWGHPVKCITSSNPAFFISLYNTFDAGSGSTCTLTTQFLQ